MPYLLTVKGGMPADQLPAAEKSFINYQVAAPEHGFGICQRIVNSEIQPGMDQDKISELDEIRPAFNKGTIRERYFTAILHAEARKRSVAAVQHPEMEVRPIAAGLQEHILMIAAQGVNFIPFSLEIEDSVNYPLAARTAIDRIAEQVQSVGLLQADNVFQEVAEGPLTAMNIRNDETTGSHA